MAESSSKKRQHESESESDDEFIGPMPVDAGNTQQATDETESKAKKKKGMNLFSTCF